MIVNDQNEGTDVKDPIEKEEQKKEKKEVVEETVEEIKAEDTEKVEEKKEETTPPKTRKKNNNEEDMMSLLDEHFSKFDKGKIVEGTVVSVDERSVLVDIGFKSESAISIREFTNTNLPEIGSLLKVFIDSVEDGSGRLRLSKKKADFYLNIEQLNEKMKNNESIQGVLRRRVKGGMIVDIDNLEAFLPGSQISTKPIPNLDQFIGKESDFKILKIDKERRNIIVSRKKVLIEEQELRLKDLKAKIVEGSELDGEVRNITDYGAFIDLGGIDGLLHITDMSWGHIKHPSDMLNIGDKVKVKVLNYDEKASKVSLGLKQLVPHPWANIEAKYPEGTIVSGKVVNITNYGVFVELESGVEGLVHISEMSWTKKIKHPKQLLKLGDTIKAIVLTTSKDDKRISLGIKQMEPNPWLTIEERYPVDSNIKGVVKSITPFGVFIEIENDIEGLIHISDISWTKRIYHPKEVFQKGQEIEVKILSIDKTLHRIALGVKQLQADPWENLDKKLPINSEVKANIVKIISKGVLVDVEVDDYTVEGFIPLSHLAIPGLKKAGMAFETGENLPLKIIELDLENRRLILSVKAYFFARDEKELEDFVDIHTKRITEKTEKRRAIKENLVEETPQKEKVKTEEKTSTEKPAEKPTEQEAPVEAVEKTTDEKPEKIKKTTEEKKKKTAKKKTEKDEKKPAKKVAKKPVKKSAEKKATVKAEKKPEEPAKKTTEEIPAEETTEEKRK
jgi:small subunit ribosomal protein S1